MSGTYLLLPPDHDGDVPDGYFTATSPSSVNWLILRGFLVDGSPETAANMFREGLRIYPLAEAGDPPAMELVSLTGRAFNTIHSNDASFYEELHAVIDREPIGVIDPEFRGLLASIGIRKGRPFAPDDRMRAILTDAAAVAQRHRRARHEHPVARQTQVVGESDEPPGLVHDEGRVTQIVQHLGRSGQRPGPPVGRARRDPQLGRPRPGVLDRRSSRCETSRWAVTPADRCDGTCDPVRAVDAEDDGSGSGSGPGL